MVSFGMKMATFRLEKECKDNGKGWTGATWGKWNGNKLTMVPAEDCRQWENRWWSGWIYFVANIYFPACNAEATALQSHTINLEKGKDKWDWIFLQETEKRTL